MEWSRERIVERAINMLYSGGHLSSQYILQQGFYGLHNAIYYKGSDHKKKYFKSFRELRRVVSKRLMELGDPKLARQILSRSYKQKIISDEEDARRKQQTIESLEEKVNSGENLSLRFQKKYHAAFYSRCVRYFDSYRGIFEANGFNYENFVKIKRTREQYEERFLSILRRNPEIDKRKLLDTYESLWKNLAQHYNGNITKALKAIAQRADEVWLSEKILSLVEKNYRPASRKRRLAKEKEMRDTVRIIHPSAHYSREDIPEIVHSKKMLGSAIYAKLKGSYNWCSTGKAAKLFGCSSSNILKSFVHKYPDKILLYESGDFRAYYFHKSVLRGYVTRNSRNLGDIERFARENDVPYSKVRSMLGTIGSESVYVGRNRELSDIEKEILSLLLQHEKDSHARIVKSIHSDSSYTLNWLNSRGIPINKIRQLVIHGKIPSSQENGKRVISGRDIKPVLTSKKNIFLYLKSIHLPGYFDTGLHSIVYISRTNDVSKETVKYRAKKLLHEDFSSVYVLSKEALSRRKNMLLSQEGRDLVLNWDNRGALRLQQAISSSAFRHTQLDAIKARQALEKLVAQDSRRDTNEIFENLNLLRDYTKERLLIGDVDVSFKHLYLVYKIMKNLGFTHVDIDRRYSVKDVVERLEIPSITNAFARGTLFDSLLKTINFTEFALAQNYDSLIDTAMSKNRIMQLDARLSAEKGLQWAVKHFNKGNFEAFASSIINKNMQWFNKNKVLSLDSKIINGDEDFTLKEVLRAESTIPILDILDTLNDKERIIVEGYLGLDGEKRTFAELASEINMTSMEIRKVYDAALKKLRNGLDNSIASLFS